MKTVELCEHSVSSLCSAGYYDTYRYRYEYIDFTSRDEKGQQHIIAKRYRLIDVAVVTTIRLSLSKSIGDYSQLFSTKGVDKQIRI